MTDDRRYDENEVRDIFARASRGEGTDSPAPPAREGLTLEELQEVGREVGLPSARIARAAAALDARPAEGGREASLGAPVAVARVVELPRAPTEREWQVLVGELRESRDTAGRLMSHGETREWTDGRLHVFLEPSVGGHRLRLSARRRDEMEIVWLGAAAVAIGLVVLVTQALDGATFGPLLETLLPAVLALLGAGSLAGRTLRLRRWADEKELEMARIAERARALVGGSESGSEDGES